MPPRYISDGDTSESPSDREDTYATTDRGTKAVTDGGTNTKEDRKLRYQLTIIHPNSQQLKSILRSYNLRTDEIHRDSWKPQSPLCIQYNQYSTLRTIQSIQYAHDNTLSTVHSV